MYVTDLLTVNVQGERGGFGKETILCEQRT